MKRGRPTHPPIPPALDGLDKQAILRRYREIRMEQIDLFATNGFRQAWKFGDPEDLDAEMAVYRASAPPLPERFAGIDRARRFLAAFRA